MNPAWNAMGNYYIDTDYLTYSIKHRCGIVLRFLSVIDFKPTS